MLTANEPPMQELERVIAGLMNEEPNDIDLFGDGGMMLTAFTFDLVKFG